MLGIFITGSVIIFAFLCFTTIKQKETSPKTHVLSFKKHGKRKNKDKGKPKKFKSKTNTSKDKKVTTPTQPVKSNKTEVVVKDNKEKILNEIPPTIKDNPWNVHNLHSNNKHPAIVTKTDNGEALILRTTTEEKDRHSKFQINDGLTDEQKDLTYVKRSMSIIPLKKIYKKVKNSRIKSKDKDLIYEEIKSIPSNVSKYEKLGNYIPENEKNKKSHT